MPCGVSVFCTVILLKGKIGREFKRLILLNSASILLLCVLNLHMEMMFTPKMIILLSLYLLLWLYITLICSYEIDFEFMVVNKSSRITQVNQTKQECSYNDCIKLCAIIESCRSLNYNALERACELSSYVANSNGDIQAAYNWSYVEKRKYQEENEAKMNVCPKPVTVREQVSDGINFTEMSMLRGLNLFNTSKLEHLSQASVCLWFRITPGTKRKRFILSFPKNGSSKCHRQFSLHVNHTNVLKFYGTSRPVLGVYDIKHGMSYHVCLTFSSTKGISIHVNGRCVFSNNAGIGKTLDFRRGYLGQNYGICGVSVTKNAFVEHIASLNIWSRVLTNNEIEDTLIGKLPNEPTVSWQDMVLLANS